MLNRSDILRLRDSIGDVYVKFMVKMGPAMISHQKWKSSMMVPRGRRHNFSDIVTVSDEAFCIFAIENSWVRWLTKENLIDKEREDYSWEFTEEEMLEKEAIVVRRYLKAGDHVWRKKQLVANKYSGEVRKGNDGVQGVRGWTNNGIQRYNEIRHLVAEDRKERNDIFDQEMDDHLEDLLAVCKSKRRRLDLNVPQISNETNEDDELEKLGE
jgi:hypothetical protein